MPDRIKKGEAPAIRFEKVSKVFNGKSVLDKMDLEVLQGECRVIMGPSGAGKTVLLKHMIGLLRPDSGRIWICNQEITALDREGLHELRKRIGYVFQLSALFDSMTVGQNVALGLEMHSSLQPQQIRKRVNESLAHVDLAGTSDRMPQELSGGMKKRVAIARAIAGQPSLLLYDEPTTGLDPATCKTIRELIRRLNHNLGITSVVVTHDMQTAVEIADWVSLFLNGRILAQGRPDELSQGGVLERFAHGEAL